MSHVRSILGLFERLQSVDISVHQDRCVLVRNRNASCMKCAEACTSACITCQDGEIAISPERCVGCGTCATVCPTCALEANHPNDRELYEACVQVAQNADGEVAVVCEQMLQAAAGRYDPDKVVGVTCLGRMEESALILLARAGVRRVTLVKGVCDGCRHHPGSETASLVVDTANALLAAWGRDGIARVADKLPAGTRRRDDAAYDADRRGFLADMIGAAKTVAQTTADCVVEEALGDVEIVRGGIEEGRGHREASTFQKVPEDGTLPHFLPHRRARLLQGLASFGAPDDVMVSTRLWGHVIIDIEKCSSCQMCATFCPTEAIKKFQDADGSFGVRHYPGRCVKCRCCVDICPTGALSLADEVFAVDLHSRAYERYEMRPRASQLGPHQMRDTVRNLLKSEFVYER
mgnify:FL=1